MKKWFNVGKIVNTHGIRGEVRVISITDFAAKRYKTGNIIYLFQEGSKEPVELKIASHRLHKNFNLLTFEGYDNVNQVEGFKGGLLKVPEEQLGRLPKNEFYFHEIIGCTVYTDEGEVVGEVKEILTPGANDVWVVKQEKGKDVLIPYIEQIVHTVLVEEKKIIITPMEGLLD